MFQSIHRSAAGIWSKINIQTNVTKKKITQSEFNMSICNIQFTSDMLTHPNQTLSILIPNKANTLSYFWFQ